MEEAKGTIKREKKISIDATNPRLKIKLNKKQREKNKSKGVVLGILSCVL